MSDFFFPDSFNAEAKLIRNNFRNGERKALKKQWAYFLNIPRPSGFKEKSWNPSWPEK
jgi:hypothetical protein